ncbi:MAG: fibrillarin-like rRNA/tRNA 2'-O-methyltransferase [Thermoplasmata archaeon]
MGKITPSKYFGVYSDGENFYTINGVPGFQVYGEVLKREGGKEYRRWNPKRSKLCAMLHKNLENFSFRENSSVLYLGAATGTTVSHISDIVLRGRIYAVEISRTPFVDLLRLAEMRKNIFPIMTDASKTYTYASLITRVDVIYQDIAQKNQVEIFVNAGNQFLKKEGIGYLIIKAPAIDSTKSIKEIIQICIADLEERGFTIKERIFLDPFDEEHCGLVVKKK